MAIGLSTRESIQGWIKGGMPHCMDGTTDNVKSLIHLFRVTPICEAVDFLQKYLKLCIYIYMEKMLSWLH